MSNCKLVIFFTVFLIILICKESQAGSPCIMTNGENNGNGLRTVIQDYFDCVRSQLGSHTTTRYGKRANPIHFAKLRPDLFDQQNLNQLDEKLYDDN